MNKLIFTTALAVVLGLAGIAFAKENTNSQVDDLEIRKVIAKELDGVEADDLSKTPIEGIYEIQKHMQIAYVSADGRYLIQGKIFDLKTDVDITERRLGVARQSTLNSVKQKDMIVFTPKKTKHTVTVFTDIDCGYCRKLHREMAQLHGNNIEVRYMFFPRSGPGTESWQKAESVWCAKDQNDAMTRAKNGENVANVTCDNPIQAHYDLGRAVGLRGTPAILLESGELLAGYMPADDLAARLDAQAN